MSSSITSFPAPPSCSCNQTFYFSIPSHCRKTDQLWKGKIKCGRDWFWFSVCVLKQGFGTSLRFPCAFSMWLDLLPGISQKSTMGTRNSCNISFFEICWLGIVVLESCTPSAQKPDSACCIEGASICLTAMCKWSLVLPLPMAQWCPGCRTPASASQSIANSTPGPCAQRNAYLLLLSTQQR